MSKLPQISGLDVVRRRGPEELTIDSRLGLAIRSRASICKFDEFLDTQPARTNEAAQYALGNFLVIGNR